MLIKARQELPDKVLECVITLILFHCGISGYNEIFAILPSEIQFFVDEGREMSKLDLY
jgi:hypothetical protein